MTTKSGFYDSLSGDRKYDASQLSKLFEGIITDGIFQSVGDALGVSTSTGMNVTVGSGRAWFNNTWTDNDSDIVLAISPSEVALNRIDAVVLEVNKETSVRENTIKVLKGVPATTPVAPTLSNTSTIKQYALAHITVNFGVTQITSGNIVNKRGTTGTPFITGLVDTIDVSTLLAQFEYDFNEWFTNLQNQLDSNQATNLQNQINALQVVDSGHDSDIIELNTGWFLVSETWTYANSRAFNVPTNATTKYKKGWCVRWKQGGSFKYGTISSVTETYVNLINNTSYTITNEPVTDIYFSKTGLDSLDFPEAFSFNPVLQGFTLGNATLVSVYTVSGNIIKGKISVKALVSGSTAAITGQIKFTPPVAPSAYYISYDTVGAAALVDSGVSLFMGESVINGSYIELRAINVAATYAFWQATNNGAPLTFGNDDSFTMDFSYMY